VEVTGTASAERIGTSRSLAPAAALAEGDTLVTGAASRLLVRLAGEVELRLGARSRMLLDSVATQDGGTVLRHASGPFWFTRPESAPRRPVAVVSPAALIAVRGTSFWGGEIDGLFGVFVARGEAEVTAGGILRRLSPGEGTDIENGLPGPLTRWSPSRISRALASVGLTP
jgi:ferric-dicitrate binding protein FerR (iron transport regulator)